MSPYSSENDVFGAKVFYAAMVAISTVVLFAAIASTLPVTPAGHTLASAAHAVQTVTASAVSGSVS